MKCMKCKFIIFSCLLLCVLNMYNMLFEYGYMSIIIKDKIFKWFSSIWRMFKIFVYSKVE